MVQSANEKQIRARNKGDRRVGWVAVLYQVVADSLSNNVTFEQRHDSKPHRYQRGDYSR